MIRSISRQFFPIFLKITKFREIFAARFYIKIIYHQVANEAMPRENSILHLLLRMMGLGLSAWDMIDTQEFMEPKLNTGLLTRFVPSLMSLVVDDQIRAINDKLPDDQHESAITIIGKNHSKIREISFYILAKQSSTPFI